MIFPERDCSALQTLNNAFLPGGTYPILASAWQLIEDHTSPLSSEQFSSLLQQDLTVGLRLLEQLGTSESLSHSSTLEETLSLIAAATARHCLSAYSLALDFATLSRQNPVWREQFTEALLLQVCATELATKLERPDLSAVILGAQMLSLASLLLSFSVPQIFVNARQRALSVGGTTNQSLEQLLGRSLEVISLEFAVSLSLPPAVKTLARDLAARIGEDRQTNPSFSNLDTANIIFAAKAIVCFLTASSAQDTFCDNSCSKTLPPGICAEVIKELPLALKKFLRDSNLQFLAHGPQLAAFIRGDSFALRSKNTLTSDELDLLPELEAVHSLALIDSMEKIMRRGQFSRSVLLLADREQRHLYGVLGLGELPFSPKNIAVRIKKGVKIENAAQSAFHSGEVICDGSPLLPRASSWVALPLHTEYGVQGVIYADSVHGSTHCLSERPQFRALLEEFKLPFKKCP